MQIQILSQTSSSAGAATSKRVPLRRIGAAAARVPSSAPHVPSDAFKSLPCAAADQDDVRDDDDHGAPQETGQAGTSTQSSTSPSTDTSTTVSSPCVTHVEAAEAAAARREGKCPSTACRLCI